MIRKLCVISVFMAFLVGCVLLGYRLIPTVLPDYKDNVRVFPESQQNQILYVEQNDELVLYPWNNFNWENCSKYNLYEALDRIYVINWLITWINESKEKHTPDEAFLFSPPVYYNAQQDACYIKDYEYQTIKGETYILSFAAYNNMPVYLDCHAKNDGQTVTDIEKLNRKLNNLVSDSNIIEYMDAMQLVDEIYDGDFPSAETFKKEKKLLDEMNQSQNQNPIEEKLLDKLSQNPIDKYLISLLYQPLSKSIYQQIERLAFEIQNAKQNIAISYNNQILLALSGESTAIIFYDPERDEITGFSVKP